MDNVTHTLFALTLARTRLWRGRGTTAALALASNAPDLDIVAALGGGSNYLTWHRGPTHGLLGVIGLGLATALLVRGGDRLIRQARGAPGGGGAPLGPLLGASVAGVLAHILMDLPTSYGTRVLSPFDWRWFALDLLPIIDIYLLIALAAGLVFGRGLPERGRRVATVVLILMAANYGLRMIVHQQALAVAARTFGPDLPAPCDPGRAFRSLLDSWPRPDPRPAGDGSCLVETAAIPTFLSPFEWRVIARLPDAYQVYDVDVLDPGRRTAAWTPNQWPPVVIDAARTRAATALLGFSRFPHARVTTDPAGVPLVRFTDMRFAELVDRQPPAARSEMFTVVVRMPADRD